MDHLQGHIRQIAHTAFEDRTFLAEYILDTKEFAVRLFATDSSQRGGNSK